MRGENHLQRRRERCLPLCRLGAGAGTGPTVGPDRCHRSGDGEAAESEPLAGRPGRLFPYYSGRRRDDLQLTLPLAGTPVQFFLAGDFSGRASPIATPTWRSSTRRATR